MGSRIQHFLWIISIQIFVAAAVVPQDFAALSALKNGAWQNTPDNWVGADPCDNWAGIGCTNSRVTSIILPSIGLIGQLSGDILQLSELQILDLSYNNGLEGPLPASIGDLKKLSILILIGCSFNSPIPDSIGSLQQLYKLDLNSNKIYGRIPPSIGKLLNLNWLDLANNSLSGSIPVSNGTTPGLDLLVKAQHFHFSKNKLSGVIPPQLFSSNMALKHVLFDSNQLVGNIPSTLGLVKKLEVIRFDNNSLNGSVPSNLNNLTSVMELYLSNNQLTGPLPNLTGMNTLHYVDMSNNSFNPSDFPPWVSTTQSLTTLVMENTQLKGQIPVSLFGLPELQTLLLRNNKLNGTLNVSSTLSDQLKLVNLQNNAIDFITETGKSRKFVLILMGNPICIVPEQEYCKNQQSNSSPYSTPPSNCNPGDCSSDKKSSPKCICARPYTGTLKFRTVSFSDLANTSVYTGLENSLMKFLQNQQLPVDSVSLSNPHKNADDYLLISLEIFPSGKDHFNVKETIDIANVFSNQTYDPEAQIFGPYFLDGYIYTVIINKSLNNGIIIGAAVGGSVFVLLSLLAGLYAFRQKKRAERFDRMNHPFASWDPNTSNGDVPDLKGVKCFSFEDLRKYSNNFSEANSIGSGGYGKVYKGILPTGKLVAIKRAQRGSMQGGIEFKSEIELLSRIHHKNVVSLVGFCFDQAEQMLVYEYIPNGSLNEGLSGKSGIRMDWIRRLRIALGAARGLHYLHELADPPIIHRDIKSNNILLDERLNAKVADFGLSKPLGDIEKGHVTTQVKGTMGYMDPEYYMTQQLTEKSDVYSFGVVMLELITARQPIQKGKYIVREVKQNMDKTKVLYNLNEVLDPALSGTVLKGLEKFVDVAMRCVEEASDDRPTMGEVVKEIENIMQIAGLNPNAESASTSASFDVVSKGYSHPYNDESLFVYSGSFLPSKLEPH